MNSLSPQLIDILNRYSGTQDIGTQLSLALKNAEKKEIVIPVLGMQGMGKSTLINAILKENILPNDADETTCVPVEIKYGEVEDACVFFHDGKIESGLNTLEELSIYVDNINNPGNEKGVDHIVLYRRLPILSNGLTLVDLPGVGSITDANQQTTERYISNLCSAIFVIPTVPTIRKMEAMFIKAAWLQFSMAIFVQNDWGESPQEIKESVDYNTMRLRQIAEEINTPFDGKVIVVNAYDALVGALEKEHSRYRDSNIESLTSRIEEIANHWEQNKEETLNWRIKDALESCLSNIDKLLTELNISEEEVHRKREQDFRLYQDQTRNLRNRITEIQSYIGQKEEDFYFFTRKKAEEVVGKMRAEMFRIIDGGIYDGSQLNEAFAHIQEEFMPDYSDTLISWFSDFGHELETKLECIVASVYSSEAFKSEETIERKKELKYEKSFQALGSIGGSGIGAGLTLLLGSNPAGWAVACVIGACAIVGGIAGAFLKGWRKKKRAKEAKAEMESLFEKIESNLITSTESRFDDYRASIKENLNQILQKRRDEEKEIKANIKIPVNKEAESQLVQDKEIIQKQINKFANV